MLTKLTLIIFSRNRKSLLKEQYLRYSSKVFKVIVLDGSDEYDSELSQLCSQDSNIYYNNESYFERMHFASKLILTPYSMILADDDLYSWDIIKRSVDVLENNVHYSYCSWYYLTAHSESNKIKLDFNPAQIPNLEQFNDDLKIRLYCKSSNYTASSYYSVTRTSVMLNRLQTVYEVLSLLDPSIERNSTPYFIELLQELISEFSGPGFMLDSIGTIRSNFIVSHLTLGRGIGLHYYILNLFNLYKIISIVNIVSSKLDSKKQISNLNLVLFFSLLRYSLFSMKSILSNPNISLIAKLLFLLNLQSVKHRIIISVKILFKIKFKLDNKDHNFSSVVIDIRHIKKVILKFLFFIPKADSNYTEKNHTFNANKLIVT